VEEDLQPLEEGRHLVPGGDAVFDEVEKANSTLILVKAVDPNPLPPNLFTKAWLESKSR